jgi:TatD DNase family protein
MYFDAHIHLERYSDEEVDQFCRDASLAGMIAVATDLVSSRRTLELKRRYGPTIFAACGFHPEQPAKEVRDLISFIRENHREIDAIGEIGLPYYLRREAALKGEKWEEAPYLDILKQMLELAAELDKPVILHGVREDVSTLCDWLDSYRIKKAHFHWIKADEKTLARMAELGYYISFTPDVLYKERSQKIALYYPLDLIMAETDGPWPFEGPLAGRRTVPRMVGKVVKELARLRGMEEREIAQIVLENARRFIAQGQNGK